MRQPYETTRVDGSQFKSATGKLPPLDINMGRASILPLLWPYMEQAAIYDVLKAGADPRTKRPGAAKTSAAPTPVPATFFGATPTIRRTNRAKISTRFR